MKNSQVKLKPIRVDLDLQHGNNIAPELADIPSTLQISAWVDAVLQQQNWSGEASISVRVVDEDEMRVLNQTYRHKLGSTNILSFPFSAPEGVDLPLLGDLVVCLPVLRREAQQQGKTMLQHWAHLIVHGTLHLLGYDHIDASDAEVMENREREILTLFAIPDPYGEIDKQ